MDPIWGTKGSVYAMITVMDKDSVQATVESGYGKIIGMDKGLVRGTVRFGYAIMGMDKGLIRGMAPFASAIIIGTVQSVNVVMLCMDQSARDRSQHISGVDDDEDLGEFTSVV